jgi:hypothetical protein
MGERIVACTSLLYSTELRDIVTTILEEHGLVIDRDAVIAYVHGSCKASWTPGIEIDEFIGWDEELLLELATRTKDLKLWWLTILGDCGDYTVTVRFNNGAYKAVTVRYRDDGMLIVTTNEDGKTHE